MKKEDQIILKRRARELAKVLPVNDYQGRTELNMVKFLLTPEIYCIESRYVKEVSSLKELTPIPNTPAFILGVVNLRGQILSIVDLKKFFNLKESGLSALNKIVVLSSPALQFGIIADKILGNAYISLAELDPAPLNISGIGAEFILGIAGDGTIILNGSALLETKTLIVNQLEKNK